MLAGIIPSMDVSFDVHNGVSFYFSAVIHQLVTLSEANQWASLTDGLSATNAQHIQPIPLYRRSHTMVLFRAGLLIFSVGSVRACLLLCRRARAQHCR